jgi:hypothetical protein
MEMSPELAQVRQYYSQRLATFGPTPRGVDWNSAESQELRFDQLLKIIGTPSARITIGDYGCGYGALLAHLRGNQFVGGYRGYDIAPNMIDAARQLHPDEPGEHFSTRDDVLESCNFVVASGIFNVKLEATLEAWIDYIYRTLDRLAELATSAFAFNVLTSYSDPERMRQDLYYADPCALFDRCKRRYSRNVALLHDYNLYEFTILVRLDA